MWLESFAATTSTVKLAKKFTTVLFQRYRIFSILFWRALYTVLAMFCCFFFRTWITSMPTFLGEDGTTTTMLVSLH